MLPLTDEEVHEQLVNLRALHRRQELTDMEFSDAVEDIIEHSERWVH